MTHAKIQESLIAKLFQENADQLMFSESELALCKLPAHELRRLIFSHSQNLTLPKLIQLFHFQKQQRRNQDFALTEVLYKEPLERAAALQVTAEQKGLQTVDDFPLLGFVMSLKDSVRYKGTDSTWGFFANVGKPFAESAPLISYLETKGAIVTCKGNVAQGLMLIESDNEAFGWVRNPFDESRTAGGSSGGEAALIANGLVNASIGSDIGGSLRVPALFCGIYTLKPTAGRLASVETDMFEHFPKQQQKGEGQSLILSTIGPLTKNLVDLEIFMRVMNDYSKIDATLPPLPWKKAQVPVKVGWISASKEFLDICPTTSRALSEAMSALSSAGIELVKVDLDDLINEICINDFAIFYKEEFFKNLIMGNSSLKENLVEQLAKNKIWFSMSEEKLRAEIEAKKDSQRDSFMYKCLLLGKLKNYTSLWQRQKELTDAVIARFKQAGVEVALAPGAPPAFKLNNSFDVDLCAAYIYAWNYLNFPVGALPITKVKADEQFYTHGQTDVFYNKMNEQMKGTENLPVGVQVVGLPWKDELVIEAMKLIDSMIKK